MPCGVIPLPNYVRVSKSVAYEFLPEAAWPTSPAGHTAASSGCIPSVFTLEKMQFSLHWVGLVTNLSLTEYTETHHQMMTTWKIFSFRQGTFFCLILLSQPPPIHFVLLFFSLFPVRLFPLLLLTRKHVGWLFFFFCLCNTFLLV